jgi:hypothetical protein
LNLSSLFPTVSKANWIPKILNTQSSENEVSDYFDEVSKIKVEINNIGLYTTDGNIISSTSDYQTISDPLAETWFQGAIQNKTY